ncbi:MAG: hypothetical protein HY744_22060 [Deltaproteobacteria bacterium]|nr:hypothetical protein [Deltaproteobacteria bacterium]
MLEVKRHGGFWITGRGARTGALVAAGAALAAGCGGRSYEDLYGAAGGSAPAPTYGLVQRLNRTGADEIDLLLVIDNSRSMADKQQILQLAVPDLVGALVNPRCLDADGAPVHPQPSDPTDPCPPGARREFAAVLDIHIGVVTSSLGGHGADACNPSVDPTQNPSVDDHARLISRQSTQGGEKVPTFEDLGFLAWDPTQKYGGETDPARLIDRLAKIVAGAGEVGCGYEAPLESWYRFLVDPDPYQSISVEDGNAVLEGTDGVLLAQRAAFLRPDSLLAVVMLSDENDCSIRDGSQYYYAAQIYTPSSGQSTPYHLPKPRAACAVDPRDPCCRSCGQPPGEGCDTSQDDCAGTLAPQDDQINLRCFDQKRRFGIDFLQPIDRYATALQSATVPDRAGNVQPNPLFTDLVPGDEHVNVRDPSLVLVAGIVGVPWQDIARRTHGGKPDLLTGLDADGRPAGGYQSAEQLVSLGTWDLVLGDPDNYVGPDDPFMVESIDPRQGTNPLTGDAIQPPGSPKHASAINGHEYTIPGRDDLQYACVFDLFAPRNCADPAQVACDCFDPANDNPLCQDDQDGFGQIQFRAKAYPGRRQLQFLQRSGAQGIVASICPAQLVDAGAFDLGYRPAIVAIVERLEAALAGTCLARSLPVDKKGRAACFVLEARLTSGACSCTGRGRRAVSAAHRAAVAAAEADPANPGWNCFCEIVQVAGEDLDACQNEIEEPVVNSHGEPVDGWCYIDATAKPPVGSPDLVASCPPGERRLVRFTGGGQGAPGSALFLACQ